MNTAMHGGNTLSGNTENGGGWRGSRWRIAAWTTAALILLLPLVAMQFTNEVNWALGDFIIAGILLFGALGVYEIATRKTGNTAYRAGVGLGVVATLLLLWGNAAVGITDTAADAMYLGVAAIGIIGIIIARFRSDRAARTMFAAALAMVLVAVIALVAGMVAPHNSAFGVLGITGFFMVLFIGSAWLFREAARGNP